MKANKFFLLIILGLILLTPLTSADAIEEIKEKVVELGCYILELLFYISSALAALFILLGGVKYVTSEAPEDRCAARNNVGYAIIGLLIIMIACPLVDYFIQGTEVMTLKERNCCPVYPIVSGPAEDEGEEGEEGGEGEELDCANFGESCASKECCKTFHECCPECNRCYQFCPNDFCCDSDDDCWGANDVCDLTINKCKTGEGNCPDLVTGETCPHDCPDTCFCAATGAKLPHPYRCGFSCPILEDGETCPSLSTCPDTCYCMATGKRIPPEAKCE